MKNTAAHSLKLIFLSVFAALISSCSSEDASLIQPKSWMDGEGTVKAFDVFLDFNGTQYKSSTELHSYSATLKNKVISGSFEVYNFDKSGNPVSDAQGEITCIAFDKDCKTARITGIITSGSDPEFLGLYAVWTVVDDGGVINETTDIRYPIDGETAKYHCEVGVTLEWYNLKNCFPAGGKVEVESRDCN